MSHMRSRLSHRAALVLLLQMLVCCTFSTAFAERPAREATPADLELAATLAQAEEGDTASAAAAADPSTFGVRHSNKHGKYPGRAKPDYRRYCSCASPDAISPPYTGARTKPSAAAAKPQSTAATAASSSVAGYRGYGGYNGYGGSSNGNNQCYRSLPSVSPGGFCGATLGVCSPGYCCGQQGICSKDPSACDGTCQCAFSGVGSRCRGQFPFPVPKPRTLPVAARGGVCSPYVARCPAGQCCSQFFFCVDDGSIYCKSPTCHKDLSPSSQNCLQAHTKHNVNATIHKFDWIVGWTNMTPDGFTRPVITVNGVATPTFAVTNLKVNDRFIITVHNRLKEGLSIHSHGILQMFTNTMDGVAAVTERPLMPGETKVYNFLLPNAGSYWWHSHFKTQYMDGLWGMFVVHDPTEKQYDADTTVSVNEWYHEVSNTLLDFYLSPASGGDDPTPYGALMNGIGQATCVVGNATGCQYAYVQGVASSCKNPKTRIRLLNGGGYANFNISIDNHRLIIIAEDAVRIEPKEVGSLRINTGQRYDVLPCQLSDTPSTDPVWIRATIIDDDLVFPSNYNTTLGVLYFTPDKPTKLPTTTAKFLPPALSPAASGNGIINPYFLSLPEPVAPPPSTKTQLFTVNFYNEPRGAANGTLYAHFNLISLDMQPESPNLLERLSNNPANLGPPTNPPFPGGRGWHVVNVDLGDVVDLVILNPSAPEHPMHLHGHWFFIMAGGLPNSGIDYKKAKLAATIARDTATVNINSYLVVRFVAANPGTWIFHCHIEWHLAGGLGLIFKVGFPNK